MSIDAVTPLRRRMIEDMNARKLSAQTQRGHILSCRRFAAFLKRSPDTATAEDIRLFQLHLAETGDAARPVRVKSAVSTVCQRQSVLLTLIKSLKLHNL